MLLTSPQKAAKMLRWISPGARRVRILMVVRFLMNVCNGKAFSAAVVKPTGCV